MVSLPCGVEVVDQNLRIFLPAASNAKSASNEGSFLYPPSKYMKEKRDDSSIVKCMNFNCTTVLTHTYFLPYTAINHADVAAVLHPINEDFRKIEAKVSTKIGWQRHRHDPYLGRTEL